MAGAMLLGADVHAVDAMRDGDGEGGVLPGAINTDLPLLPDARFGCFEEATPDLVVTLAG